MTYAEWKKEMTRHFPEMEDTDALSYKEFREAMCCKYSETADCSGCMLAECAFEGRNS
jgi:hypothetical protein